MNRVLKFVAGCLLAGIVGLPAVGWADDSQGRFQLRVSLYPWVPEPESFLQWIEADFESKHPNIDLVVRALKKSFDWEPEYVADLAYESDKTFAALTDESNPDFQHIVELDTLILGSLAERGAIAPFTVKRASFLPAAAEAVTWNGQTLGVPHWTCGYFVISEDPQIRKAKNVESLISTLSAAGTERVDLAGDLDGSWDSILVYLDAFRDTYPGRDLQQALERPGMHPVIEGYLQDLRSACTKDGKSYCGEDAVELFATGNADALIGYSERLHPILSQADRTVGTLHIASAPLGNGDEPTLFTDALVLSSRCDSAQCKKAARRFAAYYVSDEIFEVALMSLDSGGVPRYLLPSTTTAFNYGRVAQDRFYRQLKKEIKGARPYPNSGVPEAREEGLIQQILRDALGL